MGKVHVTNASKLGAPGLNQLTDPFTDNGGTSSEWCKDLTLVTHYHPMPHPREKLPTQVVWIILEVPISMDYITKL